MMNHGSSKPDWGSFLRGVVGQNFLLAFSFLSYMECINIFITLFPCGSFEGLYKCLGSMSCTLRGMLRHNGRWNSGLHSHSR